MDNKYEKISLSLLPWGVTSEFIRKVLPDNSLRLERYSESEGCQPRIEEREELNGDKKFVVTIPPKKQRIDTIIFIYRTSRNCYMVVGSDGTGIKSTACKNLEEVATFIKANYCRQLTKLKL